MNACLVKPHHAGLFSNILKVITCLRIYENVCVDWSEGSLYGDCWADLFEPTTQHYAPAEIITDYPFYDLTSLMAGILYQNEAWGWRQRFHPLWEKLGCKVKPLDVDCDTGVLVRSEGHRGEQLSDKTQSYDDYAKHLKDDSKVFLMARDKETREWFNKRFVVWCASETKLSEKRSDTDTHLTEPQTTEDAIQVMKEMLTLAKCKTLLHPVSNISTCALIVNPEMKSIYLR